MDKVMDSNLKHQFMQIKRTVIKFTTKTNRNIYKRLAILLLL